VREGTVCIYVNLIQTREKRLYIGNLESEGYEETYRKRNVTLCKGDGNEIYKL